MKIFFLIFLNNEWILRRRIIMQLCEVCILFTKSIPAVSIPLYPVVVPVDREIISQEQVITKEFDSSTGERRVLILVEGRGIRLRDSSTSFVVTFHIG